ncbi:nucleoside deaminase [uncultured Amphritea sp.]|uniref:nucleoside deaminase n=1 Tax=uncultured Amphritea sp. TaxID=981605 RepID=UPI002608FF99|nr:nucleoside deaminase [uncultured Amphritea sp.]
MTTTLDQATAAALNLRLQACLADSDYQDDLHGLHVCRLALDALEQGNYGVAAILIDPQGEVIAQSENRVFSCVTHNKVDYARGSVSYSSRAHAEMLLIDQLEEGFLPYAPEQLTMLVTLEPCPMCTARLLLSGIGSVRYIANDPEGGMLRHVDKLPPAWTNLAQLQNHYHAHVSAPVRQLATDIGVANLTALRAQLVQQIRP